MADDVDEKKIPYSFDQRIVSSIPYGINSIIKNSIWRKILSYSVCQMRNLRFYASRFIGFHVLRALNEENIKESSKLCMSKTCLRQLFKCIAHHSSSPKCEFARQSLASWKEICAKNDIKMPSIQYLNTMSTKIFEEYYVSFSNYHKYGLVDHYIRMVREKYDLSKKMAIHVAGIVFGELKLPLKENLQDTYENSSIRMTSKFIVARDEELLLVNSWKEQVTTIEGRIRFHHMILKNTINRSASIVPLCGSELPFVPVCFRTLEDLYKLSSLKTFDLKCDITPLTFDKPTSLYDILSHKNMSKLKRGYYIRTLRTNGVVVNVLWSKNIVVKTLLTKRKYDTLQKNTSKYQEAKKKKIEECMMKYGKVNKNITRKRDPKIRKNGFECPKKSGLLEAKCGVFTKTALIDCHIPENIPIVSIDPGHKNVLTASCTTLKDSNPMPSVSLSLKQYYHEIGNNGQRKFLKKIKRRLNLHEVENKLSENSLKTQDLDTYVKHLDVVLKCSRKLIAFYGSRNQARRKFRRLQKRQRFMSTIAQRIAPNKNTIIALGDAKFAACCPGLSACPIAKVVQELAKTRRVVITPEYNTTKRCSHCKSINGNTISGRSTTWKTNCKGKKYRPLIHGLPPFGGYLRFAQAGIVSNARGI